MEWAYLRAVNLARMRNLPLSQLEDYLENLPMTDTSAVLTEKLAELCEANGKPQTATEFYRHALELNPTPEQKIRIRLALGRELLSQNETAEAIANYQKLLEENPGWTGRDNIFGKITVLQQKTSPKNSAH